MSDVSSSSSALPPASGTAAVSPAPVTPGQTGQQQTPSQGEPHSQPSPPAPPPDTAVTLAPTLAGLSEGETVAVTVLSHDADGRQIVQAARAVLVTLDPEQLPESATVTLRVTAIAHDHLRAQLTSVDGETPATQHTVRLRVVQVSFPEANAATPAKAPTGVATPLTPTLQQGAIVAAQLAPTTSALSAPQPSTAATPTAVPAATAPTTGPVAFFRIVAATPPAALGPSLAPTTAATTVTARPTPAPSIGASPPPATTSAPSVGTPPATPGTSPPPPAGRAPQQPVGTHAPGVTATNPQSSAAGAAARPAQITGTITASPRPDQTAVATSTGTIHLAHPAPAQWPEGTRLVLEAVDPPRPDGQTTAIAAATLAPSSTATRPLDQVLMTLGEDWPALRALESHTATAAPATAQAFVDNKVPAANARAAAQIMFFLSVLRSGDVAGWLGSDMMRSLERAGQRGLIERLGDDFRQLRRLGDETSASDWRLLLFPFAAGDKIEPIHMFVRGQRRDQTDDDQDIRFVVDLKMSALGALQFDGLLHRQTFDLMVRSHAELSSDQRQDITRIFNVGLEAIGYRGQVGFQTVREFPVSPFNDLLGGRHTPGTIVA